MTLAFVLTPFIHSQLQALNIFIFSAFIFAAIALGDTRLHLIGAVTCMAPMLLSISFLVTVQEVLALLLFFIFAAVFFLITILLSLKRIVNRVTVDTNTLLLAMCVYYAIAIAWAMLYGIVMTLTPDAFNLSTDVHFQENINNLMYFSLVTLTTLGYGDIQPLSPAAKSLAAMESVVGQVYLTVLVARLVGLHIASTPKTK